MLDSACQLFDSAQINFFNYQRNFSSKLLIIISDGRGIFYEGMEAVKSSIQNCIQNGVFVVFIILDVNDKSSIFDIRMPIFGLNRVCIKKL